MTPRFQHTSRLIKESRKKVGLSQKGLAVRLGYESAQYISNMERCLSGPPKSAIKALARALRVPARDIVGAMMLDYEQDLLRACR